MDANEVAVFLWQNVRQLAASQTYAERQVFVWVCGSVLSHTHGALQRLQMADNDKYIRLDGSQTLDN